MAQHIAGLRHSAQASSNDWKDRPGMSPFWVDRSHQVLQAKPAVRSMQPREKPSCDSSHWCQNVIWTCMLKMNVSGRVVYPPGRTAY